MSLYFREPPWGTAHHFPLRGIPILPGMQGNFVNMLCEILDCRAADIMGYKKENHEQ